MKRGHGAIWTDKKNIWSWGWLREADQMMVEWKWCSEVFEGKNREGKWVSSRRTCLKETTLTTRSCQTGSDFSYNAAATTADSSHNDPYWKIVTKEILKHGSRSLPFCIVGVTLCWVFCVQWGCHYLIFSTHLVQLQIRKRQVYYFQVLNLFLVEKIKTILVFLFSLN